MRRLTRFVVKVFLLFFAWLGIGITFGVWLAVLKTSVDGGPWLWPVGYIGTKVGIKASGSPRITVRKMLLLNPINLPNNLTNI